MFGENDQYSLKDLYDVKLKATYDMEIAGHLYQKGEVIAAFDRITMSAIDQVTTRVAARGGYDNPAHVIWESTKEVAFSFSQGVFSNTQLALQGNTRLYNLSKMADYSIKIPTEEICEANENGIIELSHVPHEELFVYNKDTMYLIESYAYEGNKILGINPYTNCVVRYKYLYESNSTIMTMGRQLITGYLRLEAKTRLKEDNTGRVVTALISIPRLKLMSDLSMRLGIEAGPVVGSFQAVGYPIGSRGNKEILDLVILDDDIDIE